MNFSLVFSIQLLSVQSKLSTDYCLMSTSVVENNGVEPLTSCVQGRRSSQLS